MGRFQRNDLPDKTVLVAPVYEALKERVMDQVYPPGARLNIDALAVELQVSPTPVREALARLAAERLVNFEPYKGYSVTPPLTLRQVADLMHVRRLLEVEAARLAPTRILVPDLMILEKTLHEMSASQMGSWSRGYRRFNQLDQRFHETLVAAADNAFLLEAYRSLNVHVQLGRYSTEWGDPEQCDTCSEHDRILKALSDRDPEATIQAIEAHLQSTELRIFKLMEPEIPSFSGFPHD